VEPDPTEVSAGATPPAVTARRASVDIVVQLLARGVMLLLGVVTTLVVIRTLGDERFGQWSTILAVAEIVGYLSALYSIEQVAVERAAADHATARNWLGAQLGLSLVSPLLATIVSCVVLLVIADDAAMRIAGALFSATIFAGGINASRTVFQAKVRNDVSAAVMTLNSMLWTGVVVLVALSDGGLVPLAAGYLAVALATAGLQLALALRTGMIEMRGGRERWGRLLRAAVPLAGAALLTVAYTRIDQVLVYQLSGAAEAGLYGAVYRVLDRAQLVPLAVVTTLLPMLAAAWTHDRARFGRLFQDAAEFLWIAALLPLGLTLVASEPLVELLFGGEFADAAPALPILMGAFVAISLGPLAVNAIVVLGRQRRLATYALAGLVINVALNLVLIPPYGFLAAAWVTLVTEVAVVGLALWEVIRHLDEPPALSRFVRAALAAALMTLALWGLSELGASLAILVAAAVVIYGLLLQALGALDLRRLRALLRRG
jgi:O-antigen/teichoic acid export membrane protein